MSLRLKALIFLASWGAAVAIYVAVVWLERFETNAERFLASTETRHLAHVAETVSHLLLDKRLASVHELLAGELEENPDWVSIRVVDKMNRRLFPLSEVEPLEGPRVRVIDQDILHHEEPIARIELTVDFSHGLWSLQQDSISLLATIAISLTLAILAVVVFLEFVVRAPIEALSRASVRLADGDFEIGLPRAGNDEVGRLVACFAKMRDEIQHQQDAVSLAKGALERAVVERTQELEETNRALTREVEERRAAEAASHENEALVGALIEHSPVALSIKDLNGTYIFVSPAFTRFIGLAEDDMIGRRREDILSPDGAEAMRAADDYVLQSGKALPHDQAIPVQHGAATMLVTKFPIIDRFGTVTGIGTVGIDITELKRAEEKRHQSEELLKQATDLAGLGHYLWDREEGHFLACSENHARFHGLAEEAPVAQVSSPEGDLKRVHPSDRQALIAKGLAIERGEPFTAEYRIVEAHGEVRYVKGLAKPVLDHSGTVVREVGATQDITDFRLQELSIRKSEWHYRELFEESAFAIFEEDWHVLKSMLDEALDGGAVDCLGYLKAQPQFLQGLFRAIVRSAISEAAVRVYRAESKSALLDALGSVEVEPEDLVGFAESVSSFYEGASQFEYEVDLVACDGTPIRTRFKTVIPKRYREDWSRVLVSIEDITEQRKSEERLRQSQKMDAIGQLTGGIAHDFNNILMVVDGYARHAEDAIERGEDARDAISRIRSASDKAAALTKQLLTFSRRQVMERRTFRISDEIGEIDGLLRRAVGEIYDLSFDINNPEACVKTDPAEFTQAILNLVVNSRDAMPRGGLIVVGSRLVELGEQEATTIGGLDAGRYVVVWVKDQGTGMDPETLAHVFEPFFTTKEQGKGTGLGLAMVYGFAQQSSGAISVSTAPGAGCTFELYLPAVDQAPDVVSAGIESSDRGSGEVILLAEDDPELLTLTRMTLESLDYKVLTAADGFEAIEVESGYDGDIDLLLSDVVMPGLGGLELADILKASRPGLGVLFMSGYPNRDGQNNVPPELANSFLQKPVKPIRLAQAIRAQLSAGGSGLAVPA